jgi:AraC-like DNA-binding protein
VASRAFTVSGSTVAALAGWVRSRGASLDDPLRAAGLDERALAAPDLRVPASLNDTLWHLAAERLRDDDLGLRFAEAFDVDGFHLVGHLALTSRTVGEALERVVAFSKLLHDAGRTELERPRRGNVLLFPGCRGLPAPPPRHIAEFNAATAVVMIRAVTALPGWKPRAVAFQHAAPKSTLAHRRVFGVAPSFGAVEDVIELDPADLARPVRVTAPTKLGRYLEAYATELLAKLDDDDDALRAQVLRSIVTALPSGSVSLEQVAARFSTTGRTLQRRLAETGDSFADLLDEAREQLARRHLAEPALPLAEISFLLGFKDPATFNKAFKRWAGQTPGAFRAHHARSM